MYTSPDVLFARPRREKPSISAASRASFERASFEVGTR